MKIFSICFMFVLAAILPSQAESVKNQIKFQEFSEKQTVISMEFQYSSEGKGTVLFEKRGYDWKAIVRDSSRKIIKMFDIPSSKILDIGILNLRGEGNEDIFFAGKQLGSDFHITQLNLLNTKQLSLITLSMRFDDQKTNPLPIVKRSENFSQSSLAQESSFLEKIKLEYGFLDQQMIEQDSNNPKYAFYFWAKDNINLVNGTMKIRPYQGPVSDLGKITDQWEENGVEYISYKMGPVIAYNKSKNEHVVLFHPNSMYHWPTVFRKVNDYLVIGTKGEGVIVIDLKNFRFKRHRFFNHDDDVKRIKLLEGNKVLVNDFRVIPLNW